MKSSFVRRSIRRLQAYVPGEQPRLKGLVKLNTNENPYSPSRKVTRAIQRKLSDGLRLYPDPTSDRLRARIAEVYGFRMDQVIVGNGSDDILRMCLQAFVDEEGTVQFPEPTYSLYPVLAEIQNGRVRQAPFGAAFQLDPRSLHPDASVTFIANPNAPSGTLLPTKILAEISRRLKGVLVIDEAYADFARANSLDLARRARNVLVTRSFSKSFALAGIRLGFAMGSKELVAALFKVKDSYNVDCLAQVAGEAALADMGYHRRCVGRVVRTREWLCRELGRRGWVSFPSEANFLFSRPPRYPAAAWMQKLRERKILVRWFDGPRTRDYLRTTIGTPAQMRRFVAAVDEIHR